MATTDKWEAQYSFWASFGIPAYEENSVPDLDDVSFPYITYQASSSPFDGRVPVSANIWTRGPSWADADGLSDAVEARLKDGGEQVRYSGGTLWITANDPFSTPMGDPNDNMIKRKWLSVTLHFS